MQKPPARIDNEFEKLIQGIGVDYRTSAIAQKAFTRGRKIKSVDELMRIVLLYGGVDESVREVAGNMALIGIELSDQAVTERLAKCQPWLQDVVSKLMAMPRQITKPLARSRHRLLVADMTDVVGPGAKGSQWRVHLVMDLHSLELVDINISDYHTVESLRLIKVQSGDLVLADRAYCRRDAIFESVAQGAELLLRYNHKALPVYNSQGNKIDLVKHFRKQARDTITTTEVSIISSQGEEKKVWLHCYRLKKKEAAAALKRCRHNNRKVKSGVSQQTLFMSGLVVVLSTLAPSELNGEIALQLYRCRWQIELVIKRFKSLLNLDKLRVRFKGSLAQVWLYGKMLYVLLIDQNARLTLTDSYQCDSNRTQTPWRIWKLLRHCVNTVITSCLFWDNYQWQAALRLLAERSRKRKLQHVPQPLMRLLNPLKLAA